ncbi:MAG: ABATE domain-containing protein [Chloroflexota bacterium]
MDDLRTGARSPSDADEHGIAAPDRHGHLAPIEDGLEFINTGRLVRGRRVEELVDPDAMIAWLTAHNLLHDDARARLRARYATVPSSGEAAVALMRHVRDALRGLLEANVAGRSPAAADLRVVNGALRARSVYVLIPAPDGVSFDHEHVGDPIAGALERLAECVARELSQGRPDLMRFCESPDCGEAFIDRSRTGRRRWCDMATCGNRAKAARLRERRRASATIDAAVPDAPRLVSIEPSA